MGRGAGDRRQRGTSRTVPCEGERRRRGEEGERENGEGMMELNWYIVLQSRTNVLFPRLLQDVSTVFGCLVFLIFSNLQATYTVLLTI